MEYQSTPTAQTSDQLPSLRELLYVVMLRKGIVAAIFSTVIVVAAILVFGVISPKYEASATVIINVSQLAMPIVDGIPSDFEKLSTFQTQKDVIKSVVVASKVVDQLNLQETRILSNIEKVKRSAAMSAGRWAAGSASSAGRSRRTLGLRRSMPFIPASKSSQNRKARR